MSDETRSADPRLSGPRLFEDAGNLQTADLKGGGLRYTADC
jgi:hypothetical protein